MVRQVFRKIMQVLMVLAVLSLGTEIAHAGPGGGTYYANSPAGGASGTALRKFVDSLPGLGPANKNNLGNYIPIATPITGRPGVPNDGQYYEIGIVEYGEKMHSDLPKKTTLRGYVDLNPVFLNSSTAQSRAQYLGPLIIAQRNVPVRVKITNMLPTGASGNLFIPVDTTLMGAGMGPLTAAGADCDPTLPGATCASYTQNRTAVHLHGGNSPWISDGTPHQWFTPAGETTPYKRGVGIHFVPDMWFDASGNSVASGTAGATNDPGDGSMTFYWTNQQSNRLMFYHDHSLGTTRLNVYAGMAAGYLITDQWEEALIDNGTLPNICPGGATAHCEYRYGIPLIIQDKTFVPQNVAVQDAKWSNPSWGTYGDLWFPHVYEPNQDPTSPQGANPFGRWDYGPWFWPPVTVAADKSVLPEPSTTPEAFMDTPIVNGTAYPYLNVEPKAYRFRILNASNDRFYNLSLFYADPNDPSGKEVKMVPAGPTATFPAGPFPEVAAWPTDGRAGGVPDPTTMGPKIIQIGSESGFLPYPVVHPNQPVNYNYNRRDIVVLNVQEKNLFLGAAERADVIVDFSSVPPGSTVILYNDSPAPVPAGDPRTDYYTGDPDQTVNGGAPSTLRGYGPNTRTIMQFRVVGTPAAPFDLAKLQTNLPVAFKDSQPAPLVPEPTFPVASGGNAPTELYARIQDYGLTFTEIGATVPITIPFQPKAIQELWDPYGRMNATLGVELPFTNNLVQTTIPMGYAEPATERIIDGQPQIWKITHNGVDTHPVHFHMFDVQVINRVGWDGAIRPPDENELGWKETVRMNPLEDIIVALRPKAQTLPFTLPLSNRPIDPTMPVTKEILTTDFSNPSNPVATNCAGVGTPCVTNAPRDYGYEYVWHCHILGHEENDFMRPVIFAISTSAPPAPSGLFATKGGDPTQLGLLPYVALYTNTFVNKVILQWVDGAPTTTPSSFRIDRNGVPIATVSYLPGYPPIFVDNMVAPGTAYTYQVFSFNAFNGSSATGSNIVNITTDAWPVTTGVTLTASKPSPHVVGTNVQFVATGSGAVLNPNPNNLTIAYQYRFLLNGVEVQAYSNNNMWTMPDTTPVGSYTVEVQVRTSSAVAFDVTTSIPYVVTTPPEPPVTVASPVPAVYSVPSLDVTLTATTNAPPATIYYTLDGTLPTTASLIYAAPITLTHTTTINYFAQDVNGVAEAVHSDTWYFHELDMVSSIKINNGATVTNSLLATLTLSATDPVGVATMQFANADSVTKDCTANLVWTAEEPYTTSKLWTLATGSDGNRTVCVRFRDKSLPTGVLYPAISADIILDTTAPITTPSPVPGPYTNGAPLAVTLTANETATIYYTTDGNTPTTASAAYATPIQVNSAAGSSTTIKYFAVDTAGNQEALHSDVWSMATLDLTASVQINSGATWTSTTNVTINMQASDPTGIASYELSNDGTNWAGPFASPDTTAGATVIIDHPNWTLPSGEGLKTVYVRFTDTNLGGGTTYPPITASILLGTKDAKLPGSNDNYLASALLALRIARGLTLPTPLDLVHGDVAPYNRGISYPDGKINLLDVYTILLRSVGLISTF